MWDHSVMEASELLCVRRSRGKAIVWTAIALVLLLASISYGSGGGVARTILATIGVLLFGFGMLLFAREALSPRALLVIGPDGIDQRAVSPHTMIPWKEIVDIRVIQRDHRVKTLGITVRHPELLPHRGQLGRLQRGRWLGLGVKSSLAVLAVAAEGPSGVKDASDALHGDTALHATFEIPTVALEQRPDELVAELNRRWIAAVGSTPASSDRPLPPRSAPGGAG